VLLHVPAVCLPQGGPQISCVTHVSCCHMSCVITCPSRHNACKECRGWHRRGAGQSLCGTPAHLLSSDGGHPGECAQGIQAAASPCCATTSSSECLEAVPRHVSILCMPGRFLESKACMHGRFMLEVDCIWVDSLARWQLPGTLIKPCHASQGNA